VFLPFTDSSLTDQFHKVAGFKSFTGRYSLEGIAAQQII